MSMLELEKDVDGRALDSRMMAMYSSGDPKSVKRLSYKVANLSEVHEIHSRKLDLIVGVRGRGGVG